MLFFFNLHIPTERSMLSAQWGKPAHAKANKNLLSSLTRSTFVLFLKLWKPWRSLENASVRTVTLGGCHDGRSWAPNPKWSAELHTTMPYSNLQYLSACCGMSGSHSARHCWLSFIPTHSLRVPVDFIGPAEWQTIETNERALFSSPIHKKNPFLVSSFHTRFEYCRSLVEYCRAIR
jgi:hypothetical protein